jgi:hypothetical protein
LLVNDGEPLDTRVPGLERCAAPALAIEVLAKHQEFLMYFGWKSLAAPAAIGQEVIQAQPQFGGVIPHASEVVGNSRKPLQERKRLNFGR